MNTQRFDERVRDNIAANLTRKLDRKGLSLTALAKLSDTPLATVSALASGKHIPNAALLARIAKALGVTADSLMSKPRKSR